MTFEEEEEKEESNSYIHIYIYKLLRDFIFIPILLNFDDSLEPSAFPPLEFYISIYKQFLSCKCDTQGGYGEYKRYKVWRKKTKRGYFGPFSTNGHLRSNKETWNIERSLAFFPHRPPSSLSSNHSSSFLRAVLSLAVEEEGTRQPRPVNSRSRKKRKLGVYACERHMKG